MVLPNKLLSKTKKSKYIVGLYQYIAYPVKWIHFHKIQKYLLKNYGDVIKDFKVNLSYRPGADQTPFDKPFPVWVCWWQGEDYMPEVVRICYRSLLRNAGGRHVNLITKYNYKEYIDLPRFILDKAEAGIITLTHLSDILRVFLLSKYGGLWIDSTIFVTKPLPQSIDYEIYTIKRRGISLNIARNRWTSYFFYVKNHSTLFEFLKRFLIVYIQNEEMFVDYFLLDHAITIAYNNIFEVRKLLHIIPYNNPRIIDMARYLNSAYTPSAFEKICSDTGFHKLTYKEQFYEYTQDGKLTFYGYLAQISS
jgi:hypothetical protein